MRLQLNLRLSTLVVIMLCAHSTNAQKKPWINPLENAPGTTFYQIQQSFQRNWR
ncbi:MAG: hypothetical protein JNM68_01635, partial [Dinghuibacter sp.]|nr:hypothetical protein [Dinghuibacter sp.]